MGTGVSFQFRNEQFFARSRKSRDCAEAYIMYVAQAIPQIDAEIAEKGHFWVETSSFSLLEVLIGLDNIPDQLVSDYIFFGKEDKAYSLNSL